jgi:flagellar basal body-associated protein FliL
MLPQEDPETEYDQSLFTNAEWIDVKQAATMTGVGDRQVRNIADRFAWPKKYAKKEGKPYLFFLKKPVEEYVRSKQPNKTVPQVESVQSAPHIETLPKEISSSVQSELHKEQARGSAEPLIASGKQLSTDADNAQLRSILETQNEILSRISQLETKNSGGEEAGYWKLKSETTQHFNIGLLIVTGLLVIVAGGLAVVFFNQSATLNEKNTQLAENVRAKESEILNLKELFNKLQPVQVNATQPEPSVINH